MRVSYIKKEDGQFCVKSESNSDWSGGCFDSKEKAEERLKQVEVFKHMRASVITKYRVACQVCVASYVLEAGEDGLLLKNGERIRATGEPEGPAEWQVTAGGAWPTVWQKSPDLAGEMLPYERQLSVSSDGFPQSGRANVVAKYKLSMEFPTEEARKKYLHEHPDADASNHTVKKDHTLKTRKPNMFDRATLESKKHLTTIYNSAKKLNDSRDSKEAKALADKIHKAGNTLIDHVVNVHKEMAKGGHDAKDFKALGDDQKNLENALTEYKADGLGGYGARQIMEAADKLYGTLHRVTAIHGASQ